MKKRSIITVFLLAVLCNLILMISGCYEFDFVLQPSSAEKNSSFEVEVSITTDSGGGGEEYYPIFGIKLPVGWTVQDSIPFFYDFLAFPDTGIFVYSDSLVQEMNILDPPETGYYWWVAMGLDFVPYYPDLTFLFNPVITTDSSTGGFYLDYMAGDSEIGEYGATGLNRKRSDNHFIGLDLLPYIQVTNTHDSGPGSLRDAISKVENNGTVEFALEETDTIQLNDELEIRRNISIIGPDAHPVCISGNNGNRIFNIHEAQTVVMSHLNLVDGVADSYGGAILCGQSTLKLFDVAISNCTANEGGGLWGEFSEFEFDHLIISGCFAEKGGGLSLLSSTPAGKNITISGCSATIGGGIYLENTDFSLQNALLKENSASSHGGAVYSGVSEPAFRNVTIANNLAMFGGGVFHLGYGDISFNISNSIIRGNGPENIYLGTKSLEDPPDLTVSHTLLENGILGITGIGDIEWLEGNIDQNPLFEGAGDHPYQLSDASPCIDAGNPDTTGMNLPFWDLMGNYRIWDGDGDGTDVIDMGAYEYGSIGVQTPELRTQNSEPKTLLFPNPATSLLNVQFMLEEPADIELTVFNQLGQKVQAITGIDYPAGLQTLQIDVSGLPAGLYFLHTSTMDNGQRTMDNAIVKFLKQ